jgi:hypothetical protein
MMGPRQVDQAALFYEVSLERHVPATHLLRSIDRFVDLSDVRNHLATNSIPQFENWGAARRAGRSAGRFCRLVAFGAAGWRDPMLIGIECAAGCCGVC